MDTKELLLTASRDTKQWSVCLWDYSSGNVIHYYKNGGVVAPKSLSLIGNDYLITADEDKPIIHVWQLNSQEPTKKLSTILPEKANALAVCPRLTYLAAGIGVKLYLWHISSGKLFSVQKRNFQPITCVKFSSDGDFLLVAGQDGMLVVYSLLSLVSLHNNYLSQNEIGQTEPFYTKHDHSTMITDVFTGSFGKKSRIATVSSDQTCKIYSLATGELLLSLVFNEPLTAVIFDGPCWNLFVGTSSGRIHQFHLRNPPRSLESHVENNLVFEGHQKKITGLDLNITNTNIVSGSDDNFVFIWEIRSRQILRRIEHKGPVTHVKFVMNHEHFFAHNFKPKMIVKNLERGLNQSQLFIDSKIQDFDVEMSDDESDFKRSEGGDDAQAENARLRTINQQIYEAALKVSRRDNKF